MASKGEIVQALATMTVAFDVKDLDKGRIQLYVDHLGDIEGPVLAAVTRRLVDTFRWPRLPLVSEIRAEAVAISTVGRPSAHEAWGQVIDQVRTIGSYGTPSLPPDTARALHAIGGWRRVCFAEPDEQMANRSQFIRAYDTLTAQENHDLQLLPGDRHKTVAELLEEGERRTGRKIIPIGTGGST